MKKIYIFFLFIFAINSSFAQNFSITEELVATDVVTTLAYINLSSDTIKYVLFDEYVQEYGYKKKELTYKKIYKDGLLYFKLPEKFPKIVYWQDKPTKDTLLILLGKMVIDKEPAVSSKYYHDGAIMVFGAASGSDQSPLPCIIPHFNFFDCVGRVYKDCSSYLVEGKKEYKVEELSNCNVDTPWVEGVKGDGIGEGFTIDKITISGKKNPFPYLLIMNGYISYEKPYLYKQNNRIKKIKVTGLSSGKSKVLDVLDTPHPQTVDISFITEKEDIRVEIADVYKGSKYDDTCLNFCVTYPVKVIPYEDSVR